MSNLANATLYRKTIYGIAVHAMMLFTAVGCMEFLSGYLSCWIGFFSGGVTAMFFGKCEER